MIVLNMSIAQWQQLTSSHTFTCGSSDLQVARYIRIANKQVSFNQTFFKELIFFWTKLTKILFLMAHYAMKTEIIDFL